MIPKVSVIVPVYGAEAYLERCVTSLRNQTLKELQILLVDDGSPDGCPALCDMYAREDSRITVVHKENQGAGLARNAGLALARGEYVGFADADDYVLPEMYERLYTAAREHDADLVLSGARHVGGILFEAQGREEYRHCFAETEVFQGPEGMERLMLGTAGAAPEEPEDSRYGFAVWKDLFRRSILEREGVAFLSEREYASEDALFLLDFLACCRRAVGIPGAYYCYCRNGASFSRSHQEERFVRQKTLVREMERRLAKVMPEARFRPYTDRQLQAGGRVAAIQEVLYGREARLPGEEVRRRLRTICGDRELSAVLRRYPYWKLPGMQAVFAFAMRWRLVGLQQLLVVLREKL